MKNHYLLWAVGPDRPGIVAAVTKALYEQRCNLEDCSMMRLGREFAILMIYTAERAHALASVEKSLQGTVRKLGLKMGGSKISARLAAFAPLKGSPWIVRVHGADQPGIVHQVTSLLAKHKFNITDLASHRTGRGKTPGYILMVEGEVPRARHQPLKRDLSTLATRLRIQISVQELSAQAL